MTNKIVPIKPSEIKIEQLLKQVSKFDLWIVMQEINQIKPQGFYEGHLPDKQWMVNIIHTLKGKLCVLQPESVSLVSQQELKQISKMKKIVRRVTSLHRKSQGRFYKRSKAQAKQYNDLKFKEKNNKQQQNNNNQIY